jgi:putative transposase
MGDTALVGEADMPRQARLDIPGLLYHVMARGIEGRDIFLSSKDREEFLARIVEMASEKGGPKVYAWALMSNHFHLLLRPAETHLSTLMQRLMTAHAVNFNKRHKRKGHLFQNRYKSIVIEEDSYFLELVRYIHLNPVRAGIVNTLAALDKYRYSGHSVVMGKRDYAAQDVDGVLSWFSNERKTALERYRHFVEEGFEQGEREDLRGGGLIRSAGGVIALLLRGHDGHDSADERILGSSEFVEFVLKATHPEFPASGLDEILEEVAGSSGIPVKVILSQSRSRVVCRARVEFFRRAQVEAGATVTDLGRITGRSHVAVLRALNRAWHGKDEEEETEH